MICPECKELGDIKRMKLVKGDESLYEISDRVWQCPECYYEEPCQFDEDDIDEDYEQEDE